MTILKRRAAWLLLVALPCEHSGASTTFARLFEQGRTWPRFLSGVSAQRPLWMKTASGATVPEDVLERARSAGRGMEFLVVAEDWCPDSAYALPYVARLAELAGIPLRVLGRAEGAPLMRAHTTPDGRTVTPTVVLWRDGRDVGAWIERPAELQEMFHSISASPENAQRFARRGLWYEADGGRTVLKEVLAAMERAGGKNQRPAPEPAPRGRDQD